MITRLFSRGPATVVLEPYRLAREDAQYTVRVPLTDFPRIAEALGPAGAGGMVAVDAHFFRDEQGRPCVEGAVRLEGRQRCANCEREEALALEVRVDLVVLRDEAAQAQYAGHRDPITLDGKKVPLADVFEDDLLLALPERPCAAQVEPCPHAEALWALASQQVPEREAPKKRENPFAALAQLKTGELPPE